MKILPRDWYRMTLEEHILAYYGHQRKYYLESLLHRKVAYQVYLSIPKEKGASIVPINRYWPIPLVGKDGEVSLDRIRKIREHFLGVIKKEKAAQKAN